MTDLSGIWVALVTPFHRAGMAPHAHPINHAALRRLVTHLKHSGISGITALGSTAEAAALDDDEQDAVLGTVLEAAGGLPVMAGLAGKHIGQLHARLAQLNRLPLAAVLSPAPCYVRPSQAGLVAHFSALADASRAPLVVYDIPYRTGAHMTLDTLLTLAAHPNILGIKDCGGSADKTQRLIADGRLQVLAGEDGQVFQSLCLGGAGAISATAQVAPRAFMALYDAIRQERLGVARAIQHRLGPFIQALFAQPNPCLIKTALQHQGLCDDVVRAPFLVNDDEAIHKDLLAALDAVAGMAA